MEKVEGCPEDVGGLLDVSSVATLEEDVDLPVDLAVRMVRLVGTQGVWLACLLSLCDRCHCVLSFIVQNVSEGEGREPRGDGPQGGRPPRPRYRRRLPRQSRGPPRSSQSEGEGKGKVCHKTDFYSLFRHCLQPKFTTCVNENSDLCNCEIDFIWCGAPM